MNKPTHFLVGLMLLIGLSCSCQEKLILQQGIQGRVLWEEGNRMPVIDGELPEPEPIQRQVLIYEVTSRSQAKEKGGYFYAELETELIMKVSSKKDGTFEVNLPAGNYSVFVKEEQGLFANSFDQEDNLNVVTVEKNKITEMKIVVNYKATY